MRKFPSGLQNNPGYVGVGDVSLGERKMVVINYAGDTP